MLAIVLSALALALVLVLLLAMAAHRAILAWRFRDVRRGLTVRWSALALPAKRNVLKALGVRCFAKEVGVAELDRLFHGVLASSKAALRDHGWLDLALLEEELSLAFETGPADEAEGRSAGGSRT